MPTSFERRREEFGQRLRELREAAGYETGKQSATVIGWNAPKVSKTENGRQTASDGDLEAWIDATGAPQQQADELRAMLAAIHQAYATWKEKVRGGHRGRQEESITLEGQARTIRAFEVGIAPGLVHTAEYARHTLLIHAELHGGGQDITEAVRARMRRQQILFEPGRTIELLFAAAALQHPHVPPEVMLGQIHRLIATIGTPDVRLGIIPAGAQVPYPLLHGWWIIDDLAMIETVTGELTIDDPDEVATYNALTDALWAVAAEGDAARDILSATAQLYNNR